MSIENLKNLKTEEQNLKECIQGIEVLGDLTSSLSEGRFDETNSILVKSIKQTTTALERQMKQIYERIRTP
jgi:hypothetical protein